MKKQHLIFITAGIVLAVLLFTSKKKKISGTIDVIQLGDKGNEVYGLQNALVGLTGIMLSNMGVYDNETLSAVQYYMSGTNSLYDSDKGTVDRAFASDLFMIQNRAKK
jgi:hypothetical protein